MNKETYLTPEIEEVQFDVDDIITTSVPDIDVDEDETPIKPW